MPLILEHPFMDFDLEWMVSEFIEQVWQRGSGSGKVRAPRVPKERTCPRKDPNEATPRPPGTAP
jgi:hypothetical protein